MSLTLTLLGLLSTPASAAEAVWHGHYRARGLLYSPWSMVPADESDRSTGTAAWADHRLRLQPSLLISSQVTAYAQLDVLPLNTWGGAADTFVDPVTGDTLATAFADGVAPGDESDGRRNLQLTRAFADVYTPIGRLRVGRMPMHWGAGIWLNDGLAYDQEFGDTSDRAQFTSRVGPVYLMAAWETLSEGYTGLGDDMQSVDFAVSYATETLGLGLYNRYRFQLDAYQGYTGSLWGRAALGPVEVETEWVGVFGRGDLDIGANDVNVATFGGLLSAKVEVDKLRGGLELGWAHGDADPDDSDLRTFTFDRDHNNMLLMFEEPLPVLAATVPNAANQGYDLSAVQSAEGISNAMYLNPRLGYALRPDLVGELSVFGALQAVPAEGSDTRAAYGWEADAHLTWQPYEAFFLKGTLGLFMPGAVFTGFSDPDLDLTFDAPVFGARLFATYEF